MNRLEKELPKYVGYRNSIFEDWRNLWVEWTHRGEIIKDIIEMSLAGKDLYLTSEYAKVLNDVLDEE